MPCPPYLSLPFLFKIRDQLLVSFLLIEGTFTVMFLIGTRWSSRSFPTQPFHNPVIYLRACACWDHLLHQGSRSSPAPVSLLPAPCAQTQPGDFFLHCLLHQPFLWREDGSHNLLQGWCSWCGVGRLSKGPASFPSGTNVSSLRFSIWQRSDSPEVTPELGSSVLNYFIKWASQSEIMFSHYVKLIVAFKDDFIAFSLVVDIILCLMQQTSLQICPKWMFC